MRLQNIRSRSKASLLGSLAVTCKDVKLIQSLERTAAGYLPNIAPLDNPVHWTVPDISAVYTPWPSSVAADDGFAERLWFDCKPDTLEGRVLPFFAQFKELIRRLSVVCSEGPFLRSSEHTAFYNILKFPLVSNSFTQCQLLSQSEIAPALRSAANVIWSASHVGIPMPCQTPVFAIRTATRNHGPKHQFADKLHLLQRQLLTMSPIEVTESLVCCMGLLQLADDNEAQAENPHVHGIFTGLVALGHLETGGLTAGTHLHITRFLGIMRSIRERDKALSYDFAWDAMDASFVDAGLRRAYRAAIGDVEVSHASLKTWTDLMAAIAFSDPETILAAWKHVCKLHITRRHCPQSRLPRLQAVEAWWLHQQITAAIWSLLDLLSCTSVQVRRRVLRRLNVAVRMNEISPKLDQRYLVSLQETILSIKNLVPWRQRSSVFHNLVDLPATDPVPLRQSFVDSDFLECAEKMVADLQTFAPGSATIALKVALFALFNWYWRNGYHYVQLVAFLAQSAKIRRKIHRLPADISVLLSPVATPHLDSGYPVEGVCQNDRRVLSRILDDFGSLGNVGSTEYITSEEQRSRLYDPFRGDMAAFTSLEASFKLLPVQDPAMEAHIELAKAVLRTCDSLVKLADLPLTNEAREVRRIRSKLASAISQRSSTGHQQVEESGRLRELSKQFDAARRSLFLVQVGLVAPLYDTFTHKLSSGMEFEITAVDTIEKRLTSKTAAKRPTWQEMRPVPPAATSPALPQVELERAEQSPALIPRMMQPSSHCRIPPTMLTAVESNPPVGCLELLKCAGS